ncbi:BON domain-containing protein [Paraburkholderia sejongensis]|uniref:BON domain-containing protein n=1 Tax=Paraburkholderia sejongensis TaxID=2886946 RepID=UPI003CE4AE85
MDTHSAGETSRCSQLIVFASCRGYAGDNLPAASSKSSPATHPSQDTIAADKNLATAVRKALKQAKHQGLKASYIRVRVKHGVVTLSGVVVDETQIDLARRVATNVQGVTGVVSKLVVNPNVGLRGSQ